MNIDFKKIKDYKKLLAILYPRASISGLDISETALRFIDLNGGITKKNGVALEPGIIEDGKLKDKGKFLSAVTQIRQAIGDINSKEKIQVIISIPPHNVYTQAFNLPPIEKKLFNKAVTLNLQLISPIDVKTAYYDWEDISDPVQKSEKLDLLGAFINKSIVDDYISALSQAGFRVVAVEFSALSMARFLREAVAGIDFSKPQVALTISSEGLDFSILKGGKLYFDYFVSWNSVQQKQISMEAFSNMLVQELKKVLTFYSGHWDGQINNLILISQGLIEETKNILSVNFPSLAVQAPSLIEKFGDLDSSWYAALGSALRGKISRSEDIFVSLMAVGTEQEFFEDQIFLFSKIWRNIFLTVFGFLVVMFFLGDILSARVSNDLDKQIAAIVGHQDGKEAAFYQQKAAEFNELAGKALTAKSKSNSFYDFFEKLKKYSGDTIDFDKITISNSGGVSIVASAPSESAAISFKNKLAEQGKFKNISLPLSNINIAPGGKVNFILSFDL